IAKDEDIAFVRCGFPVYDRVGYHRYGFMGYHGGVYLTDMITNAILEWGERG
ncbi:MAG: nitrogenase molybdenum-iron protein subunit beta, partial [Proteobacteria bacterium]|nr:nitrogenase molybdenum-iron protein subunit beta [Pseudomonadota bacterium]